MAIRGARARIRLQRVTTPRRPSCRHVVSVGALVKAGQESARDAARTQLNGVRNEHELAGDVASLPLAMGLGNRVELERAGTDLVSATVEQVPGETILTHNTLSFPVTFR